MTPWPANMALGTNSRWRTRGVFRQAAWRAPIPPGSQTYISPFALCGASQFALFALVNRVPVRAGGLQFSVESGDVPDQRTSVAEQHNDPSRPVSENITHIAHRGVARLSGLSLFERKKRILWISLGCPFAWIRKMSFEEHRTERATPTFYFGIFIREETSARLT